MFQKLISAIALLAVFNLSGCGGGGGGGGPDPGGGTPSAGTGTPPGSTGSPTGGSTTPPWTPPNFTNTDGSYLFYAGDGLTAVKASDPTVAVLVDSGTISFMTELGSYLPNYGVNPIGFWAHKRGVLYVKGTMLWYVDAGLKPIAVVHNLDVGNFCGIKGYTDGTGPSLTRIVYEVRLPTSNCDAKDTKSFSFLLGDNPSNPPSPAEHVITNTHDMTKNVYKDDGWLVSNSTGLYKYALDFQTSTKVSSVGDLYAFDYLGFGVVLLTNGVEYFVYNEHDMASLLYGPIPSITAPIDAVDFTEYQIAFLSGGNLYRWKYEAPATTTLLISNAYTPTSGVTDVRLQFQSSIAIAESVEVPSGGGGTTTAITLKTYKADGTPVATVEDGAPGSLSSFMLVGGSLYYSVYDAADLSKSYVSVGPTRLNGAMLIGMTFRPGTHIGYPINELIENVLLVRNITAPASYENASVESWKYAAVNAQLGVIPSGFTPMFVFGLGNVHLATSFDKANAHQDIFYLNTDVADSFKRLTFTPAISECAAESLGC